MAKKKEYKKISTPNIKHQAFVLEFLKDFNATRSYKEVYKASQKVSERNGSRLLGNVGVQKMLSEATSKIMQKKEITAEYVLDGIATLARKCMQEETIKKTIKLVKLDDEGNETIEYQVVDAVGDFEPTGANSAFDKLGKYHKLRTDAANVNIDVGVLKVGKKK